LAAFSSDKKTTENKSCGFIFCGSLWLALAPFYPFFLLFPFFASQEPFVSLLPRFARTALLVALASAALVARAQTPAGSEDAPLAAEPSSGAQTSAPAADALPAAPSETLEQAAERYRAKFANAAGRAAVALPEGEEAEDQRLLAEKVANGEIKIDSTQFVVVADVLKSRQNVSIWLLDPQGQSALIGAGRTSSGRRGRFDYYLTPDGVFQNLSDNGNFRAEGTKNEHGIRGYGAKGMRIYDLGWQSSFGGWGKMNPAQIRLQMHSTDPTYMESRLGMPDSKGCVRIHQNVNRFIDANGVLDRDFELNGKTWPLDPHRVRTAYSGSYIVIHRWDGEKELPTEAERVPAAR
jgi:lipoprotein-anchoring transpeptidase ErfK/SrfK